MADFGTFCLLLALVASSWAIIASYNGWRVQSGELVLSGERAVYAAWALVLLGVLALEYCIHTDRFDLEYVASYSNRALPRMYKVAALWAGQSGSILFWLFILLSYSAIVVLLNRRKNRPLMPIVVTTLSVVSTFFLVLVNFMTRPFVRLSFTPVDGNGMNPQLQNPFMAIHPPCLYTGYVGLTIPFAFAVAALVTGQLGDTWFRTTRRFTILSWFVLGTGNLLGGWWAYVELGWGGYWAWDPVENASLIPWLTATAFLHSVMIEERKKMLRVWNLSLVIMTFLLSILGTFITRSGVISSVHSFTKSEIGPVFAGFLGFCVVVAVGLLLYRLPDLKSEARLDSFVSRESTFLFNNLLLVGGALALVLMGVRDPYAVVSFSLCVFVIATTVMEFYWGTRARQKVAGQAPAAAFLSLVDRNKRRYGGFTVHLGFMLIVVGVTGSMVFKQEATASLKRGQGFALGRYTMRFDAIVRQDDSNREFMGGRLAIFEGKLFQRLMDGEQFIRRRGQHQRGLIKFLPLKFASALKALFASRVFHENPAHRFRRRGKKIRAARPGFLIITHQSQPGFMHQRGWL